MNNKNLILEVSGQTYILDIDPTQDFQFNFVSQDVRTTTNYADFSKTTTLPPTKNNNLVFRTIQDLQNRSGFDFNRKNTVYYCIDGTVYFTGTLQLSKLIYSNGKFAGAEVNINGAKKNIFNELGSKKVNQLDLSGLTHQFTEQNIANYTNATTGLTYCLINYGFPKDTNYFYVRDEVVIRPNFTDKNFYLPAFFARYLWDQIFKQNGFKYKSNFIENSSYFNNLVIPMNASVSGATIQNAFTGQYWLNEPFWMYGYTVQRDYALLFQNVLYNYNNNGPTPVIKQTDPFNMLDQNHIEYTVTRPKQGNYGGTWDLQTQGNSCLTIRKSGTYTINIDLGFNLAGSLRAAGTLQDRTFNIEVYRANHNIKRGDIDKFNYEVVEQNFSVPNDNTDYEQIMSYTYDDSVSGDTKVNINYTGDFKYGEVIYARCRPNNPPDVPFGDNYWIYTSINVRVDMTSPNYVLNHTLVDANKIYNDKFLQVNFVKDICTLFNLSYDYVDGVYYFEPKDEYINSGKVIDWSDRKYWIAEQQLTNDFITNYRYSFAEDEDIYNANYKKRKGNVYGQYKTEVDNDFISTTQEYNVTFSPAFDVWDQQFFYHVPLLSGETIKTEYNPRLLYLNRDKLYLNNYSFSTYYSPNTANNTISVADLNYSMLFDCDIVSWGNSKILSWDDGVSGYTEALSGYTYGDDVDISNNSIYNMFWNNWINTITHKDFRIVVLEIFLYPSDLLNLRFNSKIYLDGQLYYLNKIENYSYDPTISCRCELLKIPYDRFTYSPVKNVKNTNLLN